MTSINCDVTVIPNRTKQISYLDYTVFSIGPLAMSFTISFKFCLALLDIVN